MRISALPSLVALVLAAGSASSGLAADAGIDFDRDVQPILTRFGCNSGPCHGKARGQNGFQLSLLGFDSNFDYDSLTKEARGRRVFRPEADRSLLLQKPAGIVPHGGGKRFDKGSPEYNLMRDWIVQGAPRSIPGTPKLVKVTVDPADRILNLSRSGDNGPKDSVALKVTAHFSDNTTRDVTRLSQFQSNEAAIAAVNEEGTVTAGVVVGEAAIMARYQGQIAICTIAVPLPGKVEPEVYAKLPRNNYIDDLTWTKLERLGLLPSVTSADHTFLRRAHLDLIGRIPTPDETRAFLGDATPDKRAKLVDQLLERPEFADFWANKWCDLLRPNAYHVGIKATLNYDAWIRDAFRRNMPFDQFVRELISAKGSTWRKGAVTLFRDRREPAELTTIVSQIFLGVRLECAKCHHHPFEVYGQDEFYSFAAYFGRIGRKGVGISAPISGSEEMVFAAKAGDVRHPLTGAVLPPKPLFGATPELKQGEDIREALAAWVTSPENHFFAQTAANRLWADLMGRGLVEPVDDLRATNPPANGPLLEALGKDLREQGYDLKKLLRRIATSHVYGLSSQPSPRNAVDLRNGSRHYRTRLRAEVLLDAVCDITGVPETFAAMPPGTRAMEIWSHRINSTFLDAFGRPDPNQDPPCERTSDSTVVQVLHLMNSENLYQKATSDNGLAAKLAATEKTPEQVAEELYLWVYARQPDDAEKEIARKLFATEGVNRRQATEDLLWALINTPEFVYKD
ncbi:MAG: DUF1549 domain-containing protein [Planctomycetaceae bacterium]|nr:DUF1549 domain-containing protein [Planctomycetaceae bacterium]